MSEYNELIKDMKALSEEVTAPVWEVIESAIEAIGDLEGQLFDAEEEARDLQSALDAEPESKLDEADARRLHEAILEGRSADAIDMLREFCPKVYFRSAKEHANLFGSRL